MIQYTEKWKEYVGDVAENYREVVSHGLNQVAAYSLDQGGQFPPNMLLVAKEMLVSLATNLGEDLVIVDLPAFLDGRGKAQVVDIWNLGYKIDFPPTSFPVTGKQLASELMLIYNSYKTNKGMQRATIYLYVPVFLSESIVPGTYWLNTRGVVS